MLLANFLAIAVGEFFLSEQTEIIAVLMAEIPASFADAERLRLIGFLQGSERLLENIGVRRRRIAVLQYGCRGIEQIGGTGFFEYVQAFRKQAQMHDTLIGGVGGFADVAFLFEYQQRLRNGAACHAEIICDGCRRVAVFVAAGKIVQHLKMHWLQAKLGTLFTFLGTYQRCHAFNQFVNIGLLHSLQYIDDGLTGRMMNAKVVANQYFITVGLESASVCFALKVLPVI